MPGDRVRLQTLDLEDIRVAALLRLMLPGTMGVALIFAFAAAFMSKARLLFMIGVGVAEFAWLLAYLLLRAGRIRLASAVFFGSLWLIVTAFAALRGGPRAPAVMTYVTITIAVGLLWGLRVGLISAVTSSLAVLGMHLAITLDLPIIRTEMAPVLEWWAGLTTNLLLSTLIIYIATTRLLSELWQTRNAAREMTRANRLLEERTRELETEVKERQRVERELRMMGGALSFSLSGVGVTDTDGRLVFVNDVLASTWGYHRKEELIGLPVSQLWIQKGFAEAMEDFLAKGIVEGTGTARRRDGTTFEAQYAASVIRDSAGEPELLYCSVVDNSERRRAERMQAGLNRAARAMISATDTKELYAVISRELATLDLRCVIQLADDSGDYALPTFLDMAPSVIAAAERLTGLRVADFKSRIDGQSSYRRVFRDGEPEYIPDVVELTRELLPGPASVFAKPLCDLIGIRTAIFAPVMVMGRAVGMFSVHSRDLREADLPSVVAFAHQLSTAWHKVELLQELRGSLERLQETQAQLVQSQKMDAIGRLAGGVAHDFNNQLTGIMGYADLLLDESDLEGEQRSDLEEIKRTADRAAGLTRQLLAFSRKQILEPKVLDLNDAVEQMHGMLRRVIGEHIELDTRLGMDLAPVEADPTQIEQVVMNLALNARDAVGDSGKITLRTDTVTLDEQTTRKFEGTEPGRYVMIEVTDDGAGIPPEHHERLFEPFFTTKEGGRGTGLGLATIYGFVRQSRGLIEFDSEVGVGTTFRVYLPAATARETEATAVKADGTASGGVETILMAEDEENVRRLVARVLTRAGYEVLTATNGPEALALSAKHPGRIDLLLTDVVMPGGIDGSQLASRLQKNSGLPVLYMSGYTDHGIVRDGVLDEKADLLPKPFTREQLLGRVRQALDRAER